MTDIQVRNEEKVQNRPVAPPLNQSGSTYFSLKKLAQLAAIVLTTKLVYDLVYWINLDRIENIDCGFTSSSLENSGKFSNYLEMAQSGNPLGQYCVAKMYKEGIGVSRSQLDALKWFHESGKQGLYLGNKELCTYSLYYNINVEQFSPKLLSELRSSCCSPYTFTACPWWFNSSDEQVFDYSSAKRSFDLLPISNANVTMKN